MWEQIRANQRRSMILITLMGVLLVGLGAVIGLALAPVNDPFYRVTQLVNDQTEADALRLQFAVFGAIIALGIWILLYIIALAGGKEILLSSAGAREIGHEEVPRLFNVVEEMSIAAALPKRPKVYLIDNDVPNAFAVGTPQNSAVAVTTGLLSRLNRDELQGVVAHEIGHIKNEDTKFLTQAGIVLGAIVLISDIFLRGMLYGGRGRRRSGGKGGGAVIFLVLALILAILAPILAQVLYYACSRKREYLADASGALFTRYPEGLASALEKISSSASRMQEVNRVVAPMYIVNPLQGSALTSLFSTHPPTAERIRILRAMAGGAGLGQYEAAFRKVAKSSLIGRESLGGAAAVQTRAPSTEPEPAPLAQTREAVDALHRMGGYLFLACSCGVRMKVPPGYKGQSLDCPRCGRTHPIPQAALAATATLAAIAGEPVSDRPEVEGAPRSTEQTLVYRRRTSGWESFRCACGMAVQLSPSFRGDRVRCTGCGRVTRIESA